MFGLHKNGKTIPLEVSFGVFEKDKQPFFAGIFRDISSRKLADDKLHKVSEFNASIIKSAPIGIVTLSKEGKVTSANPAFLKMMGSPNLDETLKLDINILPVQHTGLTKRIKESFNSGIPFEISRVPYTSYWGVELIINIKCVPQVLKGDTTSGMVILIQNISENVKSEQALRESEAKYRSLFEHSTDAIFIATLDGDFIDVNHAFISLTGYTKSELIRSNAYILYADDIERKQYLKELKKEKSLINKEIQVRRKDKSIIPCTISISIQCNESTNQYTYQGLLRDISEQRKTDKIWITLRSLSQKLTTPLGLNKMGPIIAKDIYSIFDYDAFSLDIIDDNKELAIGLYNEDTPSHGESPVPVPAISVSFEHLERMGILSGESQLINRPDNHTTTITVPFGFTNQLSSSLMYVPISWEDKIVGVLSVQSYVENKYTHKDLEILQIFAGHIGGALVRVKQNEELGNALKLAKEGERVKSLFLANMSHEIRTPLNAILGFNELIKQSFEDIATEEQREFFGMMDNSGNRLLRTIHEILDISSLESNTIELKKEITDIKKCVMAVILELDGFARQKQLTIEFQYENEGIVSFVDPYYIQQALANILDNAIKYTHEGNISFLLKKNCELVIKDTGIGISDDYIMHVFDLFSQESEGYTKEYQGIGLGLALTKKYLELNDVAINVKSKKDIGTEFILQFPPVFET